MIVTQDVVYPGECSISTWEEIVFCIWMECPEHILSIWSTVSLKACVSLLIFCFDDLSTGVSGVLKSPTIIVLLSISPCMSVSVCLMYWGSPIWLHRYLQSLCLPLGLILWSLCSVLISCNLLYFKVYFVWYKDCYSSFLLLPICMEYIFPSSHFQSICVLRSEVGFL